MSEATGSTLTGGPELRPMESFEAALASWSLSINSLEWASTQFFQLDKLEFSDFVDLPPADARRPVRFYAHDFRKVEMQRGDLVHAVAFMCISLSLSLSLYVSHVYLL